jgi:DNA-binding FadR family transcriptional regulator
MDDSGTPVPDFLHLDAEFHVTVSRAAGNPLISTLMDALRTSIADHTLARAQALPDWERTAARLRSEHREILDALRRGDSAAAAELVRQHISGYYMETAN